MGERMEVVFSCRECGTGTRMATPAPGSLTAARLRLADAAEAWLDLCERCNAFLDREGHFADYAALAVQREEAAETMSAAKAAVAALRTARGEG